MSRRRKEKRLYNRQHGPWLPKEFRVDADEVYLKKTPDGFLVITRDPWEIFFEGVQELSQQFMSDGRSQPSVQRRKALE